MAKKKAKHETEVAPESNWEYSADDNQPLPEQSQTEAGNNQPAANDVHIDTITWTASEYMMNEKSFAWFLSLALIGILIGGAIYWITSDMVAAGLILAMITIFGIFAAQKPRSLEYIIDNRGLKIGPKVYPYQRFKSFAVIDEDGIFSVMLLPMQRFMVPISVYYDQKNEDKIVKTLSAYLPMEERGHDWVEQLMRTIGF
jgi:hypothetical protein